MKTAVIIQARMGSVRLPGKVLLTVCGKALIQYLLERVQAANLGLPVIMATSHESADDPIANFCGQQAVDCYRGSCQDVASRFIDVIDEYSLDAFVRLSGDSPLLDGEILRQAIKAFDADADLVTNIYPRSYPRGQSVEILWAECFRETLPRMRTESDREHVTSFFYQHAEEFRIRNLMHTPPLTDTSMAVDTPEDFERFQRLIETTGDVWVGMDYQQLLDRMQKSAPQQDLHA
ncbi:MAG: NTP transferase domain-containing protein [Verrucomicrobiota bacterium]|jgi:spore coat polysaccharide biosynthesis protein SpsF|nr:NTP transferase domain-containing protein [Verrucomicrobiota bacterium]